jgi:CRISPR/Cas system-associated exonuclease Cas4 (RecB family)
MEARQFHRASDLGRCVRQVVLEWLRPDAAEPTPEFEALTAWGTDLHEAEYVRLRREGWRIRRFHKPITLHPEPLTYPVVGHPDCVAERPIEDDPFRRRERVVFEIKTVSHDRFKQLVRSGPDGTRFQIACYIDLVQSRNRSVRRGILRYVCRETGEYVEYEQAASQYNWLAEFQLIEAHVQSRDLPPRPYDSPAHPACRLCPFRRTCWADYRADRTQQPAGDGLGQLIERAYMLEQQARAAHEEAARLKEEIKREMARRGVSVVATGHLVALYRVTEQRRLDVGRLPREIRDDGRYWKVLTVETLAIKEANDG